MNSRFEWLDSAEAQRRQTMEAVNAFTPGGDGPGDVHQRRSRHDRQRALPGALVLGRGARSCEPGNSPSGERHADAVGRLQPAPVGAGPQGLRLARAGDVVDKTVLVGRSTARPWDRGGCGCQRTCTASSPYCQDPCECARAVGGLRTSRTADAAHGVRPVTAEGPPTTCDRTSCPHGAEDAPGGFATGGRHPWV